jgi:formylglycine-generating enzyme required for sulfatase activity
MVAVPAGPFMMGCNERVDRACDADERPYHAVSLGAFAVDRTEVTQAAWARCLRAGACTAPTANFDPRALPDYPVTNVGWEQARAYCAWTGKRLPTEAEWEKAARGPDGRIYPWGDALPDCAFATLDICGFVTEPVGTHRRGASPYGAYDLAGNVVEWVADLYDASYYAHSPPHDPRGPEPAAFGGGPTDHVRRGGDLAIRAATVRASNRTGVYPAPAYFNLGFRCAAARAR